MKRVVVVVVLAVGLFGCGSRGPRGVSPNASATLHSQVEQIQAAATAGDVQSAADKLTQLRAQVATLHSQGQITDAAMARILAGATEVEQNLALLAPTTTAPATTTAPGTSDKKHGKGHGGDGKGNDEGD
jgi:hypothetical protein